MRKKSYKGMKVTKRMLSKCEGVCRTYEAIQYACAPLKLGRYCSNGKSVLKPLKTRVRSTFL